jgi:hypothetical protein
MREGRSVWVLSGGTVWLHRPLSSAFVEDARGAHHARLALSVDGSHGAGATQGDRLGPAGATRVYWQHVDALGSLRGARGGQHARIAASLDEGAQAACAARAPQAGRGSYRPVGLMSRMDEILLSFRLCPFMFR